MLIINNKSVLQWSDVLMQLQQATREQLAKPASTFYDEIGDFLAIESLALADVSNVVQPAPSNQLVFFPSDVVVE